MQVIAASVDRVLRTGGDKLSDEQIEEALERVVHVSLLSQMSGEMI